MRRVRVNSATTIGWIAQASRDETKAKRLNQMLNELERSGVYMNMAWRG